MFSKIITNVTHPNFFTLVVNCSQNIKVKNCKEIKAKKMLLDIINERRDIEMTNSTFSTARATILFLQLQRPQFLQFYFQYINAFNFHFNI